MKIVYDNLVNKGEDGSVIETGTDISDSDLLVFKSDYGNLSIVKKEEYTVDKTKILFSNKLHIYTRIVVIASERKHSIVNLDVADFRRRYSNLTNRFMSSKIGDMDDDLQGNMLTSYVWNIFADDIDLENTYTNITVNLTPSQSGDLEISIIEGLSHPRKKFATVKVPILNSEVGHAITKTVTLPALKGIVPASKDVLFRTEIIFNGELHGKAIHFGEPEDVPLFKHFASFEILNRRIMLSSPYKG
ncbi:hypothetical protein phiOC_p349 [Ochrobactrum phage vB_OspM_OC]|nr:hypothetical protein phiOC_p349 [Ochrobactrum phage vB_OspM_OC]